MATKKQKALIEKQFRSLSITTQNNFLLHLYSLSNENSDVFEVWLNNGEEKTLCRLQEEIKKLTINRIGKFRKLKISKLNEIVRSAKKYPLSSMAMIDIYDVLWRYTATFIIQTGFLPDRYRISCVRYLKDYLHQLETIAEPQEKIDRKHKTQKEIWNIIINGEYFPQLEDFYLEYFGNKAP